MQKEKKKNHHEPNDTAACNIHSNGFFSIENVVECLSYALFGQQMSELLRHYQKREKKNLNGKKSTPKWPFFFCSSSGNGLFG